MKWLHSKLEAALNNHQSKTFLPTQIFLSGITVVSILTIILETCPQLNDFRGTFSVVEWVAATIFSIEYISRIAVAEKKLSYILSVWGVIDLISILPTFLGVANLTFLKSVRTLRILRLMRIFRLAKISRAYLSSHDVAKTQVDFNKINIAIYFLALTSATVMFGSILYVIEARGFYATIPLGMLEALKLLIGGLGVAPTTTLAGELVTILVRLTGLALFGLLISIISGVLKEWLLGAEKS